MAPADPPAEPPAQRPRTRVLVATALGALAAALLVMAIVARVGTGTGGSGNSAGGGRDTPRFDVGPASQRAESIARSGPILFPDPRGGTRDIFVQHLGGDRWLAFEARAAGAPRQCVLRWDGSARTFSDPCDGTTYPADGTGLVSFPAAVDERGRVTVDLAGAAAP